MAPLTHIVIFGFKDDVSKATRDEVGERFHALAKESTRGADSKPYILSIRGGKDASIEGMTQGYEVRSGDVSQTDVCSASVGHRIRVAGGSRLLHSRLQGPRGARSSAPRTLTAQSFATWVKTLASKVLVIDFHDGQY